MKIIEKFIEIRDIPYSIPLSVNEINNSCAGKSIRLKSFLEKQGFQVKYRVCKYNWRDLLLPKELLDIPHINESTHVYLEVSMNGKIIKVDPTWDMALKNIFKISEWDGQNDTEIAVKSLGLFSYEESEKIMCNSTNDDILKDLEQNGLFYKAFNEYLEQNRVK